MGRTVTVTTRPDPTLTGPRRNRPDGTRTITCRYIKRSNRQCTAEVIDPDADVLLCGVHTARVVEHYMAAIATITTGSTE